MNNKTKIITLEYLLNILGVVGVFVLLFVAFLFQIVLKELPCPLCLLQRTGFLCVAIGFMLNLRFGLRPSHYAISLISALFTSFAALRQVALHVIPGTGAYGSPFLGLHLYTWSFIIGLAIVAGISFMLGLDNQYELNQVNQQPIRYPRMTNILFIGMIFFIGTNLVSTLLECGFGLCPPDPVEYLWLS